MAKDVGLSLKHIVRPSPATVSNSQVADHIAGPTDLKSDWSSTNVTDVRCLADGADLE